MGLAGLIGLILIIIMATTITPGSIFSGNLSLNPSASMCTSITINSVPSPLKSDQSAIILIKPFPESWQGPLRVSASDGILNDGHGNEGSIIETNEKIISYGGGSENGRITAQAADEGGEECLGTLEIAGSITQNCSSLTIVSDPAILTENQSAVITINTSPEEYAGTFLVQSDSGKFQLTSADFGAKGENTNTLVTSNKAVIYNGGKSGEKIRVTALGEKNSGCKETLEIGA